jgi:hypothetical protein
VHLAVWKRKENNAYALDGSGCVENFEPVASGAGARFTARIQPDNYINPAVPEIESVCSALLTEPNHYACFSLERTKIGVLVGVNTRAAKF